VTDPRFETPTEATTMKRLWPVLLVFAGTTMFGLGCGYV